MTRLRVQSDTEQTLSNAGTESARTESLRTRIITDAASWDAIGAAWDDLYAATPGAATPLHRTWLRLWWQIYADEYARDGLRIVTVWNASELVAALPLYLGRCRGGAWGARELRFLSTGEAEFEETCADYMNLLVRPQRAQVSADLLREVLQSMRWQRLRLCDMPINSILAAAFLRGNGDGFPIRAMDRGACAVADLEHGFEKYLAGLSSNSRARARRELRKFERSGASFELADASSKEHFFADLVRLHQQRWVAEGEPGCFAAPRFLAFHRQLVDCWIPSGRAVLARLAVSGEAIALVYGFRNGPNFEMYQLGVQRSVQCGIHSPGMVANLLLMQHLAREGVAHYDFLRGLSRYKRSLTTIQRPLVSLVAARHGPRTALSGTLDTVPRAWHGIRRRIPGAAL